MGRATKLTPELQVSFLEVLATGCTWDTAAGALGVDASTVRRWLTRGATEKSGRYADFAAAVRKARAEVTQLLLQRAMEATVPVSEGGPGADPLKLLAVLAPAYAPRVRLQVEQELSGLLSCLEAEFKDEPEIFERVLRAVAGEDSPGAVEPSSPLQRNPTGFAPRNPAIWPAEAIGAAALAALQDPEPKN